MSRTIGILLFDDVEELDFAGPWEVFTSAREADAELQDALATEPELSHARYFLGRLRESAQYSMPSEQE